MFHRLPHKYKEFEGMKNIIVGKGEVPWSEYKQGWIAPGGNTIRDVSEAVRIATYLDELYTKNSIRVSTKRNKHR